MGVAVVACLIGSQTTVCGQELKNPNEEIKLLQEKIKQLENVIETQQNTINQLNQELNEQTKENKRLKKLCSQAGIDISPLKDTEPSKVESKNVINVTPKQLYYFYEAPMTDVEKEERYKEKYKGKWVQWTGKIYKIQKVYEDYFVEFVYEFSDKDEANAPKKWHLPTKKVVLKIGVEFDKTLKQRILSFKTGYIVTYEGRLPDSYKGLAGLRLWHWPYEEPEGFEDFSLTDGRIVSP